MKIMNGDCLKKMNQLIEEGVKVNMVLTDPPYGVTKCKWDSIIPLQPMWEKLNKLTHDNTPILLFGTNPFLAELIHSNISNFKYNLIWDKHSVSSPSLSKVMPLQVHEEIAVFYKKKPYYNPQKAPKRHDTDSTRTSKKDMVDDGLRYPQSIIGHVPSQSKECVNNFRVHPTQKPVALLSWLIRNYTKKGDVVLDFTMGSGSTGVACVESCRDFIGIELDANYFNIAKKRIKDAILEMFLL